MKKNLRKKEIAGVAFSITIILIIMCISPMGIIKARAEEGNEKWEYSGQNERIEITITMPETDFIFEDKPMYDGEAVLKEEVEYKNAIIKRIGYVSVNETDNTINAKTLFENEDYDEIMAEIERRIRKIEPEVDKGNVKFEDFGLNESNINEFDFCNENADEEITCKENFTKENIGEGGSDTEEADDDNPDDNDDDSEDDEDDPGDDDDDDDSDDDDDPGDDDDDDDSTDDKFIEYLENISKGSFEFDSEIVNREGFNRIMIFVEYLEFDADKNDSPLSERVGNETGFSYETGLHIDTSEPTIKVEFNDSNTGYYSNHDRSAVIEIKDTYLDMESVSVIVDENEINIEEAKGNETGIEDINNNEISYREEKNKNNSQKDFKVIIKTNEKGSDVIIKNISFSGDGKHGSKVIAKDFTGHETVYTIGEFCIDTKAPIINVAIEDENQKYTNKERKAFVKIYDDNPEGESEFVYVFKEGTDSLELNIADKAGNESEYKSSEFIQDYTAPELNVEGIEDNDTFNGLLTFTVSLSDEWPDKNDSYVELIGRNENTIKYEFETNDSAMTVNVSDEKELNDDYYTLKCHSKDKSGNESEIIKEFTLNRRGSSFDISNELKDSLGKTIENITNVRIIENNISKVNPENVRTIFTHDAKVIDLEAGRDFRTTESASEKGYTYYYDFDDTLFEKEGVYTISLADTDDAGNINDTRLNEGTDEIRFAIKKSKKTDDSIIISIDEDVIAEKEEEETITTSYDINDENENSKTDVNLQNEFEVSDADKTIEEYPEETKQEDSVKIVENENENDKIQIRPLTYIKLCFLFVIIVLWIVLIVIRRKRK
ncbi:MAG: hypothetical protein K6G75_04335 [Lachnospiraceae bacterium]|nr:hypothetical protein [Lachnospiraceae bacterium]